MRKFGLIGQSLGHSFSKNFFTKKFQQEGIDAVYKNCEIPTINEVTALFEQDFSGFNVTIPYKESILPFLDELAISAEEIGAVNTVEIVNGKYIGHNTDAFGFHQMVKPFLTFEHERALVLGTGGAAKAVTFVLKSIGIDVLYISRNPQGEKQFSYKEVNEHMLNACKLVINTTPVGTFPNVEAGIPLPYECFTDKHLAVDLIYNPSETVFLRKAKENGASILNGQSMLEQQALKAWEIWNS